MAGESRHVLILQMQRLGDLVLSFPLLQWLKARHPDLHFWVAAEERFSTSLMPLSPHAGFIPADQIQGVAGWSFAAVINLSIRPEAASLAHTLKSEKKWGPVTSGDGKRRILGDWQLYRASLVRNNRHNRYHWAELNGLDCIALQDMAAGFGPAPRPLKSDRVGLFLGASEPAKKPSIAFYRALAAELAKRGMQTVLFGGPGEQGLGKKILEGQPHVATDMCNRLTVAELAAMVQTVSLFITPDTGPMHLAAWVGARTLNLSMGNVNPWETGPFQPGHYVLQPRLSCAGCWGCDRNPLPCQEAFSPARVAALAKQLSRPDPGRLEHFRPRGVKLLKTGRDEFGLYDLASVSRDDPTARDRLRTFWSRLFGARFGLFPDDVARDAWRRVEESHEELAGSFRAALEKTAADLLRRMASRIPMENGFWSAAPPMLRPLTGYIQLRLENGDYDRPAWIEALALLDLARECSGKA